MKHETNMSNEADLERVLESRDHQALSRLVSELPDESPTLAWRSELNERIRDSQRGRARSLRRRQVAWLSAATAACAVAASLVIFWPQATGRPLPTPEADQFEELIVRSHSDYVGAGGIDVMLPADTERDGS